MAAARDLVAVFLLVLALARLAASEVFFEERFEGVSLFPLQWLSLKLQF